MIRNLMLLISFLYVVTGKLSAQQNLPVWQKTSEKKPTTDWLISPVSQKAGAWISADKKDIILYNGW